MRTIGNAAGGMSGRVPPINAYQMTRLPNDAQNWLLTAFSRGSRRRTAGYSFPADGRARARALNALSFSLSGTPPRWKNASHISVRALSLRRIQDGAKDQLCQPLEPLNPLILLRRSNMAQRKSGGRKYGKAAGKTVASAMRRKKKGTLTSGPGGKGGTVKSRKQAIAIGLSEARKKGAKVPRKKAA